MDQEPQTTTVTPEKIPPRDYERVRQTQYERGARRGNAARYGLRNLPPIEEDEP